MKYKKYEIGDKVNGLTILKKETRNRKTYFYVRAEDGTEMWRRQDYLNYSPPKEPKDLVGQKFGRLTVLARAGKVKYVYIWRCQCECGNIVEVSSESLNHGTKSCGCLVSETNRIKGKENLKKFTSQDLIDGTSIKNITRKKTVKNNTSGYTGVTFDNKTNSWLAQIGFKGKNYNLGRYKDKQEAIEARRKAEKELFGSFLEKLNLNDEIEKN